MEHLHPHKNVITLKNHLGPIFLQSTVAGGWNTTYVMKKTRVMIDCFTQCQLMIFSTSSIACSTHISESNQNQLSCHSCNRSCAQVRAIHQRNAVHDSDRDNEASINSMNDFALFSWRELEVDIVLVASVRRMLAPLKVVNTDMVFRFGDEVRHAGSIWKACKQCLKIMASSKEQKEAQ